MGEAFEVQEVNIFTVQKVLILLLHSRLFCLCFLAISYFYYKILNSGRIY